ncbi:MAG TPA: hypothetical protein VGK87_13105 [Anaerolineae bacterium]|jgi:hypothetical protein
MSTTNPEAPALHRRALILVGIGGIVMVVGLVMSLFVRDFVRDVIIIPVTYVAWLADLVIRSIPQSTFWGIIVAVSILVAWRSLGSQKGFFQRRKTIVRISAEDTDRSVLSTRLDAIRRMPSSSFARESLGFELRLLVIRLLVHRERLTEAEIERQVQSRELNVPPDVYSLLTSWRTWLSTTQPASPLQQLQTVWRYFRRTPASAAPPDPVLEQRLARTVEYMETLMNDSLIGKTPKEHHD